MLFFGKERWLKRVQWKFSNNVNEGVFLAILAILVILAILTTLAILAVSALQSGFF